MKGSAEAASSGVRQRSLITMLGRKRKYFSGGVCALAATLIKKGGHSKTDARSLTWVKMEITTDIYGASRAKKKPAQTDRHCYASQLSILDSFQLW